ncbi:protein kinase [Bremerella sp. JC817]|uniref:serine/threonine protein kinase n=1 Tax=Bremerella sp. JC817 TaxID=3231756 RepID=UPI003458E455
MSKTDRELVQKITAEARRRSGQARQDFLDDTCGTDVILRQRVEELLVGGPAKTPVPQSLEITSNGAGGATPSQHSVHPKQGNSRLLPGTSVLVRVWASRAYRTIAIVSFVTLIVLLGIGSRYVVWTELCEIREQEFNALLGADVQALTMWIETRKESAAVAARDKDVQVAILSMLRKKRAREDDYSTVDVQEELDFFAKRFPNFSHTKREITDFVAEHDPVTPIGATDEVPQPAVLKDEAVYIVADTTGTIIASSIPETINQKLRGTRRLQIVADLFANKPGFIPPTRTDDEISLPAGLPNLAYAWVYAPIYDENRVPAAVICFGYYSIGNFTHSLTTARTGKTGEAYAFNADGKMLTESRFTADLWQKGMLPKGEPTRANLVLRPPYAANAPPSSPHPRFTRLITSALNSHEAGINAGIMLDPYDGYRGHDVVGAWQWLDDYNFGVTYETEAQEAYRPFTYISIAQIGLLFLIAGFAGLAYYAATSLVHMRRNVGENVVIGAYQLLRKVGEGGMGQVYLARHQMLKRPTAIKLMRPEQTDSALLKRFEREVQLSSRLKHPNTVEIYDYGKTPDNVFYYAMEYLDGITIEVLVRQYGWQSVARVLSVMRQVAASLREAHTNGLIHRDIKPLNIMLCRVGGEFDVAKVLDFGLVKNLTADPNATAVTTTTEISGTPMYIPPERVKNPTQADPRVDIYALGATAYFMLTGQTIFHSNNAVEVLVQIVTKPIPTIHEASDRVIPDALQDLISRCLAKDPNDRPQSADEVLQAVEAIMAEYPWSQQDAKDWWEQHIPTNDLMQLVDQN